MAMGQDARGMGLDAGVVISGDVASLPTAPHHGFTMVMVTGPASTSPASFVGSSRPRRLPNTAGCVRASDPRRPPHGPSVM